MLEVVEESLTPGTVIAGQYRLERPIGQGGMGAVWAARDARGGLVALKVARTDKPGDAKHVERLVREARAASLVRHPNVVPVLAVVATAAGLPCLVMPLLEGESLRALFARRGALPWPECVRLFTGIASGLSAVHAAGIVHRDLKPENVHVRGEHAMVLDFGIAKEVVAGPGGETIPPSLTSTGVMVGTPHYMAPEQIFGERDIDARSDVWAFGLMLYEALTGVLPTHGDGFGQVMKRITTADFPPVGAIVPGVPEALSRVVAAMLSRDRAARPSLATVASVLASLGSAPAGAPLAPPTTAPPPGVSPYASTALFVPGGTGATHSSPPPTTAPRAAGGGRALVLGAVGLLVLVLGGGGAALAIVFGDELRAGLGMGAGSASSAPSAPAPRPSASPIASFDPPRGAASAVATGSSALGPSEVPSAAPTPKKPSQPPPAPTPEKPQRHAVFDAGIGNFNGMGSESPRLVKAVNESLPKLQSCYPAPTDDVAWSTYNRIFWPKGGGRVVRVVPVKNGAGQEPAAESAAMVACIERMFATFSIPDATGQADNDGGASYMFTSAGYRWRSGPPPKASGP
jgi:serine/threonine-protein kinase